ncbi:MAG TPA: response regulator transcription factor [Clostridiaceae bacterium]|nr:response regulator transcription factor [Clostridiaceae bacterium]
MINKTVLIVDDDPNISELLRLYFSKDGFDVLICYNGDEVLDIYHTSSPDVIVLDLMLPGMSGFDVLRALRKESEVPILILTARGDTLDKVVGLELGADDYIEKPFEPKELIARVKAVLRRVRPRPDGIATPDNSILSKPDIITWPNLIVDRTRYTVTCGSREIEMPPKELELLYFLSSHPDRVFTREQLLENIWGFDFFGGTRTVDVHIKRIREKLDVSPHDEWRIKTVWGVGYKFETSKPDET